MSTSNGMICGRPYQVEDAAKGVRPRVVVEGLHHPKGLPIRFKSLRRAENHIRNMRLVVVVEEIT